MKTIIQSQREFFQKQQTKNIAFRKTILQKLQNKIIEKEDAICDALYADFKKPRFETLAFETQFVLAELKHVLRHLDSWSKPERVSPVLLNWPSSDYIYREPYGTVLIIAPWNYPFQLVFAPLIGALAAGNTAVIKPSEITPHTASVISEIVTSVFPPEYVTVVEGGVDVSKKLLAEQWDYIFFTGSTKVGRIVYESAAKFLTPVTLELGGKSPCIVDDTASISLAAKRIAWGKFINAGQTCIATDYILVHRSVKEKLVLALQQHIEQFYGYDIEASGDYSRTVSPGHHKELKAMLEGEVILFGGQSSDTDNFLAPTLVDEPKWDSNLMQGEIFGPVLPIISYGTVEELQKYLNRFGKPLATYIFSKNKKFQEKIITSISFGGGAINDTLVHIGNKRLPFGGVGQSGIGAYHGRTSFALFSHQKAIVKKATWIDVPFRYPPYTLPIWLVKMLKRLY